jgi:hypothetical protein
MNLNMNLTQKKKLTPKLKKQISYKLLHIEKHDDKKEYQNRSKF